MKRLAALVAIALVACCSHRYLFTFAAARGSAFTLRHPRRRPSAYIGAAGFDRPLTIRGAYIWCGRGRWLNEHGGNQPVGFWPFCKRPGEYATLPARG